MVRGKVVRDVRRKGNMGGGRRGLKERHVGDVDDIGDGIGKLKDEGK